MTARGKEKMKTHINKIYGTELEKVCIDEPPYTVFGSSVLLPSFHVAMKVDGLKEILKLADDDDSFHIEISHEKMTRYWITRKRKIVPQESGAEPVQCLTNKGQNTGESIGK